MKVIFTKINSHKSASVATRDDGVSVAIPGYGSSKPVPHDMIHFVTEDELKIDYGFWGCVAAGAIYSGMEVIEGKLRHDSERKSQELIKKVGQKISEAECFAGTIWRILCEGISNDWYRIQQLQESAWQSTKPSRPKMTHEEVKRICARVLTLEETWKGLRNGEILTLIWGVSLNRKSDRALSLQSRRKARS
jgi:hypothetical protein